MENRSRKNKWEGVSGRQIKSTATQRPPISQLPTCSSLAARPPLAIVCRRGAAWQACTCCATLVGHCEGLVGGPTVEGGCLCLSRIIRHDLGTLSTVTTGAGTEAREGDLEHSQALAVYARLQGRVSLLRGQALSAPVQAAAGCLVLETVHLSSTVRRGPEPSHRWRPTAEHRPDCALCTRKKEPLKGCGVATRRAPTSSRCSQSSWCAAQTEPRERLGALGMWPAGGPLGPRPTTRTPPRRPRSPWCRSIAGQSRVA
jgi:hypothetical protein